MYDYNQWNTWGNTRSVKVRSTTTTEYDNNGRVVKVVTVDEYEERPNYGGITFNPTPNVWYTNGSGITTISNDTNPDQ